MDRKNILIVSRAFYPIIAPRSFRATELAKEFAREGHNVTVLTHKRNHDYSDFEKKYNITIEDFVQGKWKVIIGNNLFKKGIRFILNYLLEYPDIQLTLLLKKALKVRKGYDLLLSIAVPYPVHWGVALARKNNPSLCGTWVADCGDPFMGNREKKFKYPFYFHFVESWFCRKPDYITIPIEEAISAYPKTCRNRIKIIPQGFNFEKSNFTPSKQKNNNIVLFAYAGALSKSFRDPSEFLEYLSIQSDRNFKFIVYTQSPSFIEPYKSKLGEKIEIREYIPRIQLLEELKTMDFLVNFENKNNVQSPSKLIDYAIVGKPVLSIKPFKLKRQIVNEFLKRNYTNQLVIENIEQYNIQNVSRRFLNLIKP